MKTALVIILSPLFLGVLVAMDAWLSISDKFNHPEPDVKGI